MKISILTICYNSDRTIERAIKSVIQQNYSNWEHIVVDGGSTDGTVDILKKHSHLKWISEPDKGQSDAMNKAFALSSGDIIIYLNADDELLPGYFEVIKQHFKKNTCTDLLVVKLIVDTLGKKRTVNPSTSLSDILNYWPCKFPLNPVSYSYKRELQAKIGNFPLDNHFTMDYWFLLRAFLFGKIKKEEYVGGTFFFDGANKSSDIDNAKKCLKEVRNEFIKKYFFYKPVFLFLLKEAKKKLQLIYAG